MLFMYCVYHALEAVHCCSYVIFLSCLKVKRIVGWSGFGDQLRGLLEAMRSGCGLGVVQRSACLVVGPVAVDSYSFLFGCVMVGRASGFVAILARGFDPLVGTWCLSFAGPAVAKLGIYFGYDCLWVVGPFLCVVVVCFSLVVHCVGWGPLCGLGIFVF